MKKDQSEGPPQATQRQQDPNPSRSSWASPKPLASKDTVLYMGLLVALLFICRQQLDSITITSIPLFVFLKFWTLFLSRYVQDLHHALAALLAVIGFVILQQGRLGLGFFTYQAEACYWIGYWLEWWTGVIGFLFSLLGCTTDDETRYVPGSLFSFGPQANGVGGVGVELGALPPPYSDEAIGRRLGCIGRFRSYIAHQCRKLELYLHGLGIRADQHHLPTFAALDMDAWERGRFR
ncbi:hypothetical protein PG990_009231 [Apiospora arundinis]